MNIRQIGTISASFFAGALIGAVVNCSSKSADNTPLEPNSQKKVNYIKENSKKIKLQNQIDILQENKEVVRREKEQAELKNKNSRSLQDTIVLKRTLPNDIFQKKLAE